MPVHESMFDGRLEVQPPLSEAALSRVPARRGVVGLLAEADAPILLLTAGRIRDRLRTRLREPPEEGPRKTADLRSITRAVVWTLADGHFETDLCFLELARALWPKRYPSLLGWKPPWFVHADPDADAPHFVVRRDVLAEKGRWVGPFASERSARRFVDIVRDAFDLCRHVQCLRQAPHAETCAYGQMGRCLRPCDGTTGMDAYRDAVRRAADLAEGRREDRRRELERRMAEASAELAFERAAGLKKRLERLSMLDAAEFELVRPAESFRYVMIQRGPGRREAKTFLIDRGRVAMGPLLDYPPVREQIDALAEAMAGFAAVGGGVGDIERWRMGLATAFLFSGDRRRGLMLPWDGSLDPADTADRIEEARDRLGLRAPTPPRTEEDG